MACRFCPKIKKYDLIWILLMCLAIYGVNRYENHKKERQEKIQLEAFEKLQKKCLFGDQEACKKAYK